MRFDYMQNDLILLNSGDIDIYDSDLDIACESYLSRLRDPELIYKSSNTFLGLLSYVRRTVLKPIINFTRYDKAKYNY